MLGESAANVVVRERLRWVDVAVHCRNPALKNRAVRRESGSILVLGLLAPEIIESAIHALQQLAIFPRWSGVWSGIAPFRLASECTSVTSERSD